MREVFAASDRPDMSEAALRWGLKGGAWRRLAWGAYGIGPEYPTRLDRALGLLSATGGVASGTLAGTLLEFDSMNIEGKIVTVPPGGSQRKGVRRSRLRSDEIVTVDHFRCTSGTRTLIDLANVLDDLRWEQALESALRLRRTTVEDLNSALAFRHPGNGRVRRVLRSRSTDTPATESLLETLAVQLIRSHGLPTPRRQVEVFDKWACFVARVDLAWPDCGVFIELDGQHHLNQPVHDARRETAVVAATGWLPGRFTWTEVRHHPVATARRIAQLLAARSLADR